MRKIILVTLCVIMSGCVTKAQYGSLADSYAAWYAKSKGPYLDEAKDAPASVKTARQHEVDEVGAVLSAAAQVTSSAK